MYKINIVVGLLYGDEGKGATVNNLCAEKDKTLVVRFNGGHQVGHTVVYNGMKHAFSNFGSGTLKGVPTYWSEYCTVNPLAVLKEGNVLRELGVEPIVYYNGNAMVTTPYDIYGNLNDDTILNHGSVGVGFGKTIHRNENHYHLYVRDLLFPTVRDEKLRQIGNYYGFSISFNRVIEDFKSACDLFVSRYIILNTYDKIKNLLNCENLVFEGGQGILLDQNYGFFPNVTRSNTTTKNAFEIINKYVDNGKRYDIDTYYITRAYQTRHGNGFMSNEDMDISHIKINPNETNVDTGTQGIFRRSVLDLDMLKYSIKCDEQFNSRNKRLVMTCCDHVDDNIPITDGGRLTYLTPKIIGNWLNCSHTYITNSDNGQLQIQR